MKKITSSIYFLSFISLNIISFHTNAQLSGAETLPPVVTFVLDEQEPAQENQAPVNSVPQSPIDVDTDAVSEFTIEVNDADNNLISIEVSTPLPALLSPQTLSNDVEFDDGNSSNSFIITGSQSDLQEAISVLTFIPFEGDATYTITILSTDAEGATDEDSFTVNVTGEPIIAFP